MSTTGQDTSSLVDLLNLDVQELKQYLEHLERNEDYYYECCQDEEQTIKDNIEQIKNKWIKLHYEEIEYYLNNYYNIELTDASNTYTTNEIIDMYYALMV